METNFPPIWNPFQKGYIENPHAILRILRDQNPIHKGINGRWIILKYEDVKFLLTDTAFKTVNFSETLGSKKEFVNGRGDISKLSEISTKWLLFFDPPEHTEMRSIIARIWNKYNLNEDIYSIVEKNIKLLSNKKNIDIVEDFANFIPSQVVCKLLGLPFEDYNLFRKWSYALNSMFEPFANLYDFCNFNQKIEELYNYLNTICEQKRMQPDKGFISQFITESANFKQPLTDSEIISVIAFMFFASIETSVNIFGQSVFYLLQNPTQLQLLIQDKSVEATAIEELLRYISPNQYTTRIAAKDVEIRGKKIKKGDILMVSTVSANRDETVFENAETLDLKRTKNPHLSFGYGLHYCLGARLARLELQLSLPILVRNFPNLKPHPTLKHEWDKIILNRGLKSFPVILE